MLLNFAKNGDVALLGFGRSCRAVASFLMRHGGCANIYGNAACSEEERKVFEKAGFCFKQKIPDELWESALVRSPGIRPDLPVVLRALERGAMLTDETALFFEKTPTTVIGVTGSDGKTTTAHLAAALLRAAGHTVYLGGNNGVPLLPCVEEMRQGEMVVLELSSFQLQTQKKAPHAAVITNITPNHLNWHTDMAEYVAAKARIVGDQTRLVLNAENELTARMVAKNRPHTVYFSKEDKGYPQGVFLHKQCIVVRENDEEIAYSCLDDFRLPGEYNKENLLAAMGVVAPYLAGEAPAIALREFGGVPHRHQRVGEVGGVCYINSSIDTTPTRTAAALSVFDVPPIVLAGGRGKGVSLLPLAQVLSHRAKAVFLHGETAREIGAQMGRDVPCFLFDTMQDAFWAATKYAVSGDTVLLSPGCTAFDEFRDFEERGEVFCRLVKALAEERK